MREQEHADRRRAPGPSRCVSRSSPSAEDSHDFTVAPPRARRARAAVGHCPRPSRARRAPASPRRPRSRLRCTSSARCKMKQLGIGAVARVHAHVVPEQHRVAHAFVPAKFVQRAVRVACLPRIRRARGRSRGAPSAPRTRRKSEMRMSADALNIWKPNTRSGRCAAVAISESCSAKYATANAARVRGDRSSRDRALHPERDSRQNC